MNARVRAAARIVGGLALLLASAAPSLAAPATGQAAPADASTSDVARAIRDQVGGKVRDAYRQRGFWPLWIDGRTPGRQASALVDLIGTVRVDGLDPGRYDAGRLRRLIAQAQGGDAKALAYAEVALSSAFADLVRDMRAASVEIRYLEAPLAPSRVRPDDAIRDAALAPSMATYVSQLGWMSPLYVHLREALLDSAAQPEATGTWLPDGPLLRPGAIDERVPLLRERLGLAAGDEFDAALVARVRRFQLSHGLPADGMVGARTIAALNDDESGSGMPDRRAVLRLNLERARLLPGAWTRHVVVDAAGARLWYFGGGAEQGTMRVVVGTAETQTPMMAGTIRYATLNPYWNVPVDLVRKRIAPRVLAGASLSSLGYEALSDWTAEARIVDPASIDWSAVAAGSVEARVRELPGRANSMGTVKFMFPNDLGIYLHDTPDRTLFARSDRHFSNGCVRLEDAPRLGRWLFGKTLKPASKAPEQHVAVDQPVPVYLLYFTASPTAQGIRYVADAYDRDGAALRHFASR